MKIFTSLVLAAIAGMCLTVTAPKVDAQVAVDIGVAPDCPYGYYDAAPYGCAPYGYYGSEWVTGGGFFGAGPRFLSFGDLPGPGKKPFFPARPWFHGSDEFRVHVNTRFHPEHGYPGPTPQRGEKAEPSKRIDKVAHFKGNEVRDGRGHTGGGKRS